jgi:hypothetical protein
MDTENGGIIKKLIILKIFHQIQIKYIKSIKIGKILLVDEINKGVICHIIYNKK